MIRFSRWASGAVAAALVLGACNGNVSGPDPDSETHWLGVCASDADCPADAPCTCGICTRSCDGAEACAGEIAAACAPSLDIASCAGGAVWECLFTLC